MINGRQRTSTVHLLLLNRIRSITTYPFSFHFFSWSLPLIMVETDLETISYSLFLSFLFSSSCFSIFALLTNSPTATIEGAKLNLKGVMIMFYIFIFCISICQLIGRIQRSVTIIINHTEWICLDSYERKAIDMVSKESKFFSLSFFLFLTFDIEISIKARHLYR